MLWKCLQIFVTLTLISQYMGTLSESLFSKYIIDGVEMDSTPADMLMECCAPEDWERLFPAVEQAETVVDETGDSDPAPLKYEFSKLDTYVKQVRGRMSERSNSVSVRHPEASAQVILAETVLEHLLTRRPSRLEGLGLRLAVRWDCGPVGNMAAFYKAVEAVSGYSYDLGIHFTDIEFKEVEGAHEISFEPVTSGDCEKLPSEVVEGGILIFVPFDTCSSHKLGGSVFSSVLGGGDEVGLELYDPDYFIDSYEVVHDLVEDGIALSGAVVGRGGLLPAVEGLLGKGFCLDLDMSGIQTTYMEDDPMRILFSEIPGVVLQINESDRDYVDSQFLLQDIAYYPIGKPEAGSVISGGHRIHLSIESSDELSRILSSLMDGQRAEDPEISNFAEGAETARGGGE